MKYLMFNKSAFKTVEKVIALAEKRGYLVISPMEVVSWNYDNSLVPKEDGTFDRMGLDSSDVTAEIKTYWWMPKNWDWFKKEIKDYKETLNEFVIDSFLIKLKKNPKMLLRDIYVWGIKHHPFKVSFMPWVWVCDSKKSVIETESFDLAEDIVAQKLGYKNSLEYFEKTNKIVYLGNKDEVMSLAEELRKNQKTKVWNYFINKHNYVKIADYMWVSQEDPTCFVVDETVCPFDMRDGWSKEALTKPIAAWVREMFNKDMTVIAKKEDEE